MIQTGFESRVKIQQIIDSQLPEYVLDENPKAVDFLRQYYIGQEYQGGPTDITDNLDQYLKLDNLTPEVVVGSTTLSVGISTSDTTISVSNTKGFPENYGLLKIDDEVITYTGLTTNTFTGCIRGFCGITSYHESNKQEELVFSDTTSATHTTDAKIQNLSSLFLKEFYKKTKSTLTPGLEDTPFAEQINAGNFIKESRSLYEAKGTDESFRILFNVLYGETPKVVNLEEFLIKPSSANFVRRKVAIGDVISGDITKLVGQTIYKEGDLTTNASIAEVEAFSTRGISYTENKQYYKLSLFLGYSDSESAIQGDFNVTPTSKALLPVGAGATSILVDSTIGFGQTGTLVSGGNTSIYYTSKSINQFFGVTGVDVSIDNTADIIGGDIYYGYEDGDTTKKVRIRLNGVLSEFEQTSTTLDVDEGQEISVKNIGNLIINPTTDRTYEEIFANSWIYNTGVRYKVDGDSFSGTTTFDLVDYLDRSSLKKGDIVQVIRGGSNTPEILGSGGNTTYVVNDGLNPDGKGTPWKFQSRRVYLDDSYTGTGEIYIRRVINTARSAGAPLEYDNSFSDIQNVYVGSGKTAYVASNSLPSGVTDALTGITTNFKNTITTPLQSFTAVNFIDPLSTDPTYSTTIRFDNAVPFMTGDAVYYEPTGAPVTGLSTGRYYVDVISYDKRDIKLYNSPALIDGVNYLSMKVGTASTADQKFTLFSQKDGLIGPQKVFKAFSLEQSTSTGTQVPTTFGPVGMLVNGVEITNYKSTDKVYYGPLTTTNILNGGTGYDVINLPYIEVASGIGTTALIQPVLTGTMTEAVVDPQGFNVDRVLSIDVTGGNGTAVIEPLIESKKRNVEFDGRVSTLGGGVNITLNTITFPENHSFVDAQEVVYNANGNLPLGVGIGTSTLGNYASYYAKIVGLTTISLHPTPSDAVLGSNIIDLNSTNTGGTHEFQTLADLKTVIGTRVVDGGTFTNRQLRVQPIGISTDYNTVNFENHGFNDGDLIEYKTWGTVITGIVTANQYYVSKIDDNSFKLADAGIGGTTSSNYERKNTVSFTTHGVGEQIFKYPDVTVTVNYVPVGLTTNIESILLTPKIRGSIVDSYLYEKGTGYGTTTINFEDQPLISIKTGKDAVITPVIDNGQIISVNVQNGGSEYYSVPDIDITDTSGNGSGAILRPVITNNKITSVVIVNPGIGYSSTQTSTKITSPGINAKINAKVRSLTLDIKKKYNSDELLLPTNNNKLKYSVCGYGVTYRNSFGEDPTVVSRIIGWAYDGNPIYGPYGNSDPQDSNSAATRLRSGYTASLSNIIDRPSHIGIHSAIAGIFVEDYKFDNSGDLDENNGRFSKTPEFPDGVYAYYATIHNTTYTADPSGSQFPYFIGNSYRSLPLNQNFDQSLDFAETDLVRNTFPYRSSSVNADNDYIIEPNEIDKQKVVIQSVSAGSVDEVSVVNSGENYKVGDQLTFDDTDTEGGGLSVKVSSLVGNEVYKITNSNTSITDVVLTKESDDTVRGTITGNNPLNNQDVVTISGLTTSLSALNGQYFIGIETASTILTYDLPVGTGVTEVVVADIPPSVSVGSSIGIGTETGKILNIYRNENVLTIMRGVNAHDALAGAGVTYHPNSFTFKQPIDDIDSKVNDIVYFNSEEAVGFGTTAGATGIGRTFMFANRVVSRSVPCGRVYMENHPFVEGQQVTYTQGGSTALTYVSVGSTPFTWDTPATVDTLVGGSGYSAGSASFVPTTGGTGTELYVNINTSAGAVTGVTPSSRAGRGYTVGDIITINGHGGSNATFRVASLATNVPTSSYYIRQPIPLPTPSTLYISNSTPTTVGLKTEKTGPDILFTTGGSDNDLFSLQSLYTEVEGDVNRINTQVTTVDAHGLKLGDKVKIEVSSGLTTGVSIGNTDISISRQDGTGYILVDPIGYNQLSTSSATNSFKNAFIQHNYNTGDKVYLKNTSGTLPTGLSERAYFVYVVSSTEFQLCETYKDTQSPANIVSFTGSFAGTRTFSRINPPLQIVKNNSPIFNLKDTSLSGYDLKFYYDQEFKNEFVSTATTTTSFNITTSGVVGSGTSGAKTINYNVALPNKLYYTLEKSGYISTADTTVSNYSEISYVDSNYNGSYSVVATATTTFDVASQLTPQSPYLLPTTADTLKYTTTSTNTIGGVDRVNIVSGGSDYKKLPTFVGSASTQGLGLYAVSKSKSIGNINRTRVINEGFEYSSDPTLRPQAFISPIITVNNSNSIGVATVVDGGAGYSNPPVINIVNTNTREKINTGVIQPILSGNSIHSLDIVQPPYGLPETPVTLFATSNDNGVGINTIQSDSASSGIFTCFFAHTNPSAFAINDRVFIEGISKIVGSGGTGFNSADVGYKFGRVLSYVGGVTEDAVKISYEDDFISTNCGLADTIQVNANMVKQSLYPSFSVHQVPSNFIEGEKVISNNIERDLYITSSNDDFIKVSGTYTSKLTVGEIITGAESGVIATIESLRDNEGIYNIKFGVEKNIGWSDDIGKLSSDNQVTPDNDYYQNLSYTIKSTKTFDELRSPVNGLLHTSGLKNFADTGITSTTTVGMSGTSISISVQDIISDNRVDTIYNYANAIDLSKTPTSSKLVKLTNKRLTPYQIAKSNEVLVLDNINTQFSNLDGDPSQFLNIENLVGKSSFIEYTIRITNLTYSEVQLVELVVLNNGADLILLKKSELSGTSKIGDFSLVEDVYGNKFLRFTPLPDAFDYDYDLKVLKSEVGDTSGIGTQAVGSVDMISSVGVAIPNPSYPSGITTAHIVSLDSSEYDSILVKTALTNTFTNEMSYVEIYAAHDNAGNVFKSEAFIDNDEPEGYSEDIPGNFTVGIMTASGGGISTFFVGFENTVNKDVQYKSKIVTWDADFTAGIGTYRFKVTGQPDQAERTALYQSNSVIGNTSSSPTGWTVVSLDKNLFNSANSIVEVGSDSDKREIHQVSWTHDGTDVFSHQGPILSFGQSGIGITANTDPNGIGTCWAEYDGSNIILKYKAPTTYGSTLLRTNANTLALYTQNDIINTPNTNPLNYGATSETLSIHSYNAINGDRINKKQFKLTSGTIPVFAKTFSPADVVSGDTFTIPDHFFRTGEALTYTPGSTFEGVTATAMQYSSGSVPSTVYVERIDKDSFRISATRTNATTPGSAITITGNGSGNAHKFSMPLANSKSIITIDNIIQSPIAYTNINFNLTDNADAVGGGQGISATRTTFALAGISSINPTDLLRFDDEYVKVTNVGKGTTSIGPITNFGSYNLVTVERGYVGSSATVHSDSATGRVYRGSYNIVGENINFTDPPRGNSQVLLDQRNLPFPRSEFTGRAFLRNDYSSNIVYDDISEQFTGIGRTFNLTVGGASTTGIGSTGGNGLVTINNLYQRPTTLNNTDNNYTINASGNAAITFSGIRTDVNDDPAIVNYDINQNALPRGGVIVSLGSSEGLGYAPLRSAIAYVEVGAGGSISRIVDEEQVGPSIPISAAIYNNDTGDMEVTTAEPHNFEVGIVKDVKFSGLAFTCSNNFDVYDAEYNPTTGEMVLNIGDHPLGVGQSVGIATESLGFTCALDNHAVTKYYPRAGAGSSDPLTGVTTAISAVTHNTITINVLAVTPSTNTGVHTFVSASPDAVIVRSGYSGITSTVFPYAGTGLASTSKVYPIENISIGNFVHRFESALTGAVYRGGNYPHTYVAGSTGASAIVNTTGGGSVVIGKPSAADYNAVTGVLTLTFSGAHGLVNGNTIKVADKSLAFTCSRDNHKTIHKYPRATDPKFDTDMSVTKIDANTFTVNVGTSPIVSKTPTAATYTPSTGLLEMTVGSGHGWTSAGTLPNAVTNAVYTKTDGKLVITSNAHTLSVGEYVKLSDGCLSFTCTKDGNKKVVAYPRISDPAHAKWLPITNRTTNTFTIYVGYAADSADQYTHTFVSAVAGGILKGTDASYIGIATGGLTFSCDKDDYSTLHAYPRLTDPAGDGAVLAVQSHTTDAITVDVGKLPSYRFTTNVGINSIPHKYVGRGYVYPWYSYANVGSAYRGSVSIGITDIPFDHKFVSASTPIRKLSWSGSEITPTDAYYYPSTGLMIVTAASHGLSYGMDVGIGTNSLTFTCSKDDHATEHTYPRTTDPVHNTLIPVLAKTTDTFTVDVGKSVGSGGAVTASVGAGGTLTFSLTGLGTNYANPQLVIPEPSYAGLGVTGVSRLSVGSTTDTGTGLLINVDVGAASTVGIGSTLFSVKNWEIERNGYGFRRGDVFTPVGLVTCGVTGLGVSTPQATFEVLDTFSDNFGMWNFGNMDYIDSIGELQDGERTRFDLKYDGALLSFEADTSGDFPDLDLSTCLFIIINSTIQEPGVAYNFEGGSSFVFTDPPRPTDDVSIFFYRGTYGQDTELVTNVYPTLKVGDTLQLDKIAADAVNQGDRTNVGIPTSNIVETLVYKGAGITSEGKSLNWTKQKTDKIVNGVVVSKVRDALEPLIFPTGKLIGDIPAGTVTTIYLDDASEFDYEKDVSPASSDPIAVQVVDQKPIVGASLTATVAGGVVTALTIVDGGQGYVGATTSLYISAPPEVNTDGGVGIGSTATATGTITNGVITGTTIVTAGAGYATTNPPNVLASTPPPIVDTISGINSITTYTGPIVKIESVSGTGVSKAIRFTLGGSNQPDNFPNLTAGMPIYITGTTDYPGATYDPITSVYDTVGRKVSIGSTMFDNIYNITSIGSNGSTRQVTCNVSNSGSFTTLNGTVLNPLGYYSVSILKGSGSLTRKNAVAIGVTGFTNAEPTGLSTYPTVSRRYVGIRTTGALQPTS